MKILRAMDMLLRSRGDDEQPMAALVLVGGALCSMTYAAAAGFFQGGLSVFFAAVKIPLIIFGSVVLCLPSLYIFTALAGADLSLRDFGRNVAAFCGIIGLVLLALMPIAWLFAVSTLSIGFIVWLHVFVWLTALAFAQRVLRRTARNAGGAVGLWLTLLFLVSLQMTTYMRPVLWWSPGSEFFQLEKESFFMHLEQAVNFRPAPPPPLRRGITPLSQAAAPAPHPAADASPRSR